MEKIGNRVSKKWKEFYPIEGKGKEGVQKWGLGVESEDNTLQTEQREVRNWWKDYFIDLLEGEVRGQT